MKCPKCGFEGQENQKFCSNCGAPIHAAKFCTECGSEWEITAHFCGKCGHSLPEAGAAPPQAPKIPMQAYPPPQAPSMAPPQSAQVQPVPPPSKGKEGEGESFRKHVTVLVVDMKSSTEMIRNLDPEEAKEILFPAIQKLSSIVYEYGGIVISTAGDGLVAVFGAPHALEDHALRACLAALSMQKQIKTLNAAFAIRVGLNSGEILLAMDGSRYEIVGAVVHLAARMEQTAVPGTIRLTQNTLKLVADSVSYEKLGSEEIKGFSELIEIYELKGIKVSKSLNELTNQFVERVSYVNREQEIAKVASLLGEAKAGHGNAVSVVADSGFGKSRLMFEIVTSEIAKGCNVLLTAAFIHTKEIPLLPVVSLFRGLLGISRTETDIEKIKSIITPFLTKIDTPYALNATLNLINLAPKDPEWVAIEPVMKRKYMFEVGAKLLCLYSLEKPMILVLEDMHWVDSETELFIDSLISQISKYKIFILIGFRPEYHDHWTSKPNYTRVQLAPLGVEASAKMLDNLLGNDASLVEIKKRLLSTVGGNPFFLEELVLSLIAEKIFVGESKNYHLREGTAVQEIHLPETIITIYQIKIDNLHPIEKKILQIASVIGTKFVYSQLIQLMDAVDEGEVRSALNKLTELQYIYESQLYPEPGFGFTHALTQETAYNSMLKKTKRALHFRLFQILETTLQEDQIDQLQIVAEHAFLSETWDKAFFYCVKAAEKVYEINAFSATAKNYEKALIAAEHLPQDDALALKVMRVHYELYYAYVPIGRFKEQYEHLQKALDIALAKKDRFFESIINAAFAIYYVGFKDANEALKHAELAYQIAKELNSTDAKVIAQFTLVHIYLFRAQFKELFETSRELEKLTGSLDYRSEWLKAPMPYIVLNYECWARSFVGDFAFVEERTKKWLADSKNLDRPSVPNLCLYGSMGLKSFIQSDFENAMANTSIALQYGIITETIIFVPIYFAILGEMNLRLNKTPEGKEHLNQAMNIVEQIHGTFTTIFSFVPICKCLLLIGDYARAKENCNKSIEVVKERNIKTEYPMLLRISAEVDLYLPNPNFPEIKKKLDEALQLCIQYGMLPYVGHCHLTTADLYEKMGELEKRKTELNEALSSYEKLGMKYWIERVKGMLEKK